jgi:hypothetical protein
MSLYIVELTVSLCIVKNVYVYIPYFNVTSGGIRRSKGTPIIKKKSNPSLFINGGTLKEGGKKTKVLTLNKNIGPWVPAGLDARSDHAGWLPAVSYCSALLCSEQTHRQYPESSRGQQREQLAVEENSAGRY